MRWRWRGGAAAGVLALWLGAACTTLSTPVSNENYGRGPSRAQRRARSESAMDHVVDENYGGRRSRARSDNAMDHVVRGEDPCAGELERARPRRRRDPDAGCEMSGALGVLRVEVRGDQAFQVGSFSDREMASVDEDGTLWEHTVLGEDREAGEVRCGKIVLHGLLEERVAAHIDDDAVVMTGLFQARYERPSGCDDEQAALGAFALMLVQQRVGRTVDGSDAFGPKSRPPPGPPTRPGR